MKFFRWLATMIEDKTGTISSKRIGFFWCLFMLQRVAANPTANEIVVYTVAGLAFGLAGLTIPEWFSSLKKDTNNV